jgi:hypothetical protein
MSKNSSFISNLECIFLSDIPIKQPINHPNFVVIINECAYYGLLAAIARSLFTKKRILYRFDILQYLDI